MEGVEEQIGIIWRCRCCWGDGWHVEEFSGLQGLVPSNKRAGWNSEIVGGFALRVARWLVLSTACQKGYYKNPALLGMFNASWCIQRNYQLVNWLARLTGKATLHWRPQPHVYARAAQRVVIDLGRRKNPGLLYGHEHQHILGILVPIVSLGPSCLGSQHIVLLVPGSYWSLGPLGPANFWCLADENCFSPISNPGPFSAQGSCTCVYCM